MNIDMLREHATHLGLHNIGIAPAIDEVRSAFPWAESVIVAAISYLPPENSIKDDKPRGLVARCARGADYHTVLSDKLNKLACIIQQETGALQVKVCVDTTPLPERKLAVLAGVGWRGKNCNVFVEGCGSYVSLGEIVIDVNLDATSPLEIDGCGDCNACIRACPTGALTSEYTLDRERCVAALTQTQGEIPPELIPAMHNHIYGCDICQEVCPRNAGVKPITPEFALEVFPGANPELVPLINLTSEEFKQHVKKSAIGWIGKNRIKRNAAIAASNLNCKDAP